MRPERRGAAQAEMQQKQLEQRPEVRRLIAAADERKAFAQSLVNYAAAPLGGKKYDSNTLTGAR